MTSYLAAGQGIPQISWGCTGPSLSNKAEYGLVRLIKGTGICPLRRGMHSSCNVAVLKNSGLNREQRPNIGGVDEELQSAILSHKSVLNWTFSHFLLEHGKYFPF